MIELMDIKNIEIITANKRLIPAHGRFISNPKYTAFKKHLFAMTRNIKLKPCYRISIYVECFCDIDNVIKPVLDALQMRGVIEDDKDVVMLEVDKTAIPKNKQGRIVVCGEGGYVSRGKIPLF
jgi:Holliday junction resolvase RusA-like endonuclease